MIFLKNVFLSSVILLLGWIIPQTLIADFYVIPIGQPGISASSVKNFQTSCLSSSGASETLYTVPEGKIFVVKRIEMLKCFNGAAAAQGRVKLGNNYERLIVPTEENDPKASILKFDLGIVLHAGEKISLTRQAASSTSLMMIVNGYEARP